MQAQRHDAGEAEDAQLRLESDADRVAIVTVHRSKGLEYPIVYHPFAFEGRSSRGNAKAWAQAVHDGQQLVLDYCGEALPPAARVYKTQLDEASAGRSGSPQMALMVNGKVYDYFFGSRSAELLVEMVQAVRTGSPYPVPRCLKLGPRGHQCDKPA
jgi:hypothetical protein